MTRRKKGTAAGYAGMMLDVMPELVQQAISPRTAPTGKEK
jgi:hypothetical protein